jgi:hypothetical protein
MITLEPSDLIEMHKFIDRQYTDGYNMGLRDGGLRSIATIQNLHNVLESQTQKIESLELLNREFERRFDPQSADLEKGQPVTHTGHQWESIGIGTRGKCRVCGVISTQDNEQSDCQSDTTSMTDVSAVPIMANAPKEGVK